MDELPLACALGPQDGRDRLRRWERLGELARPVARRDGHRLEVRYRPLPGVRDELAALAAAEAECCGFVRWAVRGDAEAVVLEVTADPARPADVAAIAALFGAG